MSWVAEMFDMIIHPASRKAEFDDAILRVDTAGHDLEDAFIRNDAAALQNKRMLELLNATLSGDKQRR